MLVVVAPLMSTVVPLKSPEAKPSTSPDWKLVETVTVALARSPVLRPLSVIVMPS